MYENPLDAQNAIAMYNGFEFQGNILEVREDRFAAAGPGGRGGFGGAFAGRGGFAGAGGRGGFGGAFAGAYGGGMGAGYGGGAYGAFPGAGAFGVAGAPAGPAGFNGSQFAAHAGVAPTSQIFVRNVSPLAELEAR